MPVDTVSPEKRSRIMASVRSKNTKPEMMIRSALHRKGYRFRLHRRDLPGVPDLVLPRFGAVIFVHGCFWHGHDCHLFRLPSTRRDFWKTKIDGNKARDIVQLEELTQSSWRVATIWECALKGRERIDFSDLIDDCIDWLGSTKPTLEIRGHETRATG